MKTLQSTLKFFRTWCKSKEIQLISSENVVVPCAVYQRNPERKMIYMPLISVINYLEWQRQGYHETAHLAPCNLWHYDVFRALKGKQGHMLHDIANCLVDNLAERVDFYEYRGRAEILSSGRAALSPKIGEVWKKPSQDPIHDMRSALLKWDAFNRETWMINFVFPDAHQQHQFDHFVKRMYDIQLDRIIQEVADSDDVAANTRELVELVLEIDSWIPSQNQNQQQQQSQQGGEGDEGGQENKEAAACNESGAAGGASGSEEGSEGSEEGQGNAEGSEGGEDAGGEGEDSGGSDGADPNNEPGDQGSGEQQSHASESSGSSQLTPTPSGEAPTGRTEGSNFDPNQYGAEIEEVRYTAAEQAVLEQYTRDATRPVEEDVKQDTGEAAAALQRMTGEGIYFPCQNQEYPRIQKGGFFSSIRKQNIMQSAERSLLDKQVRKHLQLRSSGRTVHGVKRGRLSSKNLHKLYQGGAQVQPGVFKRHEHGKVKTDSAVTLLVDFSGSMGSRDSAPKYELAAASAMSLAEVLNGLRIKHEILGFTHSPARNIVYHLKDFAEKPLSKEDLAEKFSSTKIYQDHNADGEALQYAAERLMQMREKNKVLMVLSDGQPNGYWKGDGRMYLRKVADDIENHSPIHLCAIGIKSSAVSQYYANYEVVSDIEELAGAVLSTLKTNLLTM